MIFEEDQVRSSDLRANVLGEYQLTSITGVAADISHINTKSTVKGYDPTPSGLREALAGAEVVLIPAGVPRKPGMTRDGMDRHATPRTKSKLTQGIDLFNTNASIVRDLAKAAADAAPDANLLVISNPVCQIVSRPSSLPTDSM